MSIRAGRLNKRITVQQATETRNSVGDPIPSWTTYAIRWASVEPLNGREYFAAKQTQSETSIRMRLRYDSVTKSVTTKMRVSWDSRFFDIESVIRPRERGDEVILMCIERV